MAKKTDRNSRTSLNIGEQVGQRIEEALKSGLKAGLRKSLGSDFDARVERGFDELKTAARHVRENSAPLGEMLDELRTLARHPRTLSQWLETRSPWLSRQVIGTATGLSEPFTLGMGLNVLRVSEEAIEVGMSGGWRNRGDGGAIHSGALATLGEFAVRLFWEHHLDLRNATLQSERVEVKRLAPPFGEMRAIFRLPISDREALLHRLRADGQLLNETETLIYDSRGRLVAEIDVDWRLERQLSLGPGASSSTDSD